MRTSRPLIITAAMATILAGAAPAADAAVKHHTVEVVQGRALTGAAPHLVDVDCGLRRPALPLPTGSVSYGPPTTSGHAGDALNFVTPPAEDAYGVLAAGTAAVKAASVAAAGTTDLGHLYAQYVTKRGATIVGMQPAPGTSLTVAWSTLQVSSSSMVWYRFASGQTKAQTEGETSLAGIVKKFPVEKGLQVGFVVGCAANNNPFALDDLTLTTKTSSTTWNFERGPVKAKVSAASARRVKYGKSVTLHGVLTPKASGVKVGIYETRGGKRRLVRTVTTGSAGTYSFTQRQTRAGRFRWQAVIAPRQTWISGSSRVATVTVAPKPRPKPKPKPAPAPKPTPAPPTSTPSPSPSPSPTPPPCSAGCPA